MIAILDNVRVMDKEVKEDKKTGDNIFILNCYQKGEKALIPVKGVPQDIFSSIKEEEKISLQVNLMAWGQNGNYGLAVRFLDIINKK